MSWRRVDIEHVRQITGAVSEKNKQTNEQTNKTTTTKQNKTKKQTNNRSDKVLTIYIRYVLGWAASEGF